MGYGMGTGRKLHALVAPLRLKRVVLGWAGCVLLPGLTDLPSAISTRSRAREHAAARAGLRARSRALRRPAAHRRARMELGAC